MSSVPQVTEGSAESPRHRLASVAEVPAGSLLRIEAGGVALCLARTEDGAFYAIDDLCPHEEASLSEGELEGCELECPLHYSRFDLRTGEALSLPATEPAGVYPVEIENGAVYALLPA